MADVIRDAVIRIRTEQTKSRLEAPDVSAAVRAHEAVSKAANEVARAHVEVAKAAAESSDSIRRNSAIAHVESSKAERAISVSSMSMVRSFNEAGEGAFRFGRGLTLLSASGGEDMRKLVQSVALAQGAFDVFAGGTKAVATLGATLGPVGAIIGGTTLALGAGAIAWQAYANSAVEATKRIESERNKAREAIRADAAGARAAGRRGEDLRAQFAEAPGEQARALAEALSSSQREEARLRGTTEIENIRRKMIRLPDGSEVTPEEFQARGPLSRVNPFTAEGRAGILSGAGGIARGGLSVPKAEVVDRLDPNAAERQLTNLKALEAEQLRQLEIQKKLNDADDEALRQRQQRGSRLLNALGLPGISDTVAQQQQAEADRLQQENVTRLLGVARQTANAIHELEKQIQQANFK